jgi:hypothetical protein
MYCMLYHKSYTLKSWANIQILLCYTNSFFKKKIKKINRLILQIFNIFTETYIGWIHIKNQCLKRVV